TRRVRQDFPRRFQREGHGRRGRATEVMTRDTAGDVLANLRQQRPDAARIFTLPAAQLDHERDRQKQLDPALSSAHEDDATRYEWLDRWRQSAGNQHALRFGDAVQELARRPR